MQAQTQEKIRVNRGNTNSNASANARERKKKIPFLALASALVFAFALHRFTSILPCICVYIARVNPARRKCKHKRRQRSVTCPPSLTKLTVQLHLRILRSSRLHSTCERRLRLRLLLRLRCTREPGLTSVETG